MSDFSYNQPNTRARIAARRKRTNVPRNESGVVPGPRRTAGAWLASGRIISLVVFIGALIGLFYISYSPRFAVSDIRVEGAQALHAEQVAELSGVQGRSIWLVDTEQVVERIQENAYIEQASAYLTLPNRLTIMVEERRPEVRWMLGNTLYLVDASGRVLGADTTAPMTNTLIIEDRSARLLQPNDHVDPDALKLGQTLTLRLPAELNLAPAHIGWSTDTGIVVTTADQKTIVFGQSDDLDRKFAVLSYILGSAEPFTYLDLRPETPYYRQ